VLRRTRQRPWKRDTLLHKLGAAHKEAGKAWGFLAYCLGVTLRKRLQAHAPGLTPRAVLETLSGILMLEGHVPLADGRELVMPRYTQPEAEHRLVLDKLGWVLPPQPPPRIRRSQVPCGAKQPEAKSKM
jgi:hypothetical protein